MKTKYVSSVGVLVYKGSEVLLVRHTAQAGHLTNTYGLPSGRVEQGETDKNAAIRELKEETGLTAASEDLLEYSNNIYRATIERKGGEKISFSWRVFIAKRFKGKLKPSKETKPVWVALTEIESLNLLPNVGRAAKDGASFIKLI